MTEEKKAQRHLSLLEAGWVRRFTAEEPRLTEMKEMYESMGLEVCLEPGALGDPEECRSCYGAERFEHRYKTIYTKAPVTPQRLQSNDLF